MIFQQTLGTYFFNKYEYENVNQRMSQRSLDFLGYLTHILFRSKLLFILLIYFISIHLVYFLGAVWTLVCLELSQTTVPLHINIVQLTAKVKCYYALYKLMQHHTLIIKPIHCDYDAIYNGNTIHFLKDFDTHSAKKKKTLYSISSAKIKILSH